MRLGYVCLLGMLWILPSLAWAQPDTISGIINQYTRITAVDAANGVLTVDDASLFTLDDKILIYQTQGAVMNETQAAQFGTVTNINGAGLYEFATVCISDAGSGEVSIQETLSQTYNPAAVATSGLQLIRVPVYAGDVVVDGTLTAAPWDGQTGGILAFEANGAVKLDADIDLDGLGFRGALAVTSSFSCTSWFNGTSVANNSTLYYYTLASGEGGQKAEGIASFIAGKTCGQGRQTNGGGGGNDHNAGGGGGGNYNGGGQGGERSNSFFNCYGIFPGRGGSGLSPYGYANNAAQNRAFLGGGGGAGHAQDMEAAAGGNGGGLLMLNAGSFNGNGQQILARGISANDSLSDGGSGGGAGGSILLDVGFFSADPFTLDARGGDGGNTAINCEGPGGGGAGGVIWTSVALDPGVSRNVAGGTSGVAEACSNSAQNAANGSNGAELTGLNLTQSGGGPNCILSAQAIDLSGQISGTTLELNWNVPEAWIADTWTLSFRGAEGLAWKSPLSGGQQEWKGIAWPGTYQVVRQGPDGSQVQSNPFIWNGTPEESLVLLDHPWKTAGRWQIGIASPQAGRWKLVMRDMRGRSVWTRNFQQNAQYERLSLDAGELLPGMYTLQVQSPKGRTFFEIVRLLD